MTLSDFHVGKTFWCAGKRWQCTDIGTRTVIAICLDRERVFDAQAIAGCFNDAGETGAATEPGSTRAA